MPFPYGVKVDDGFSTIIQFGNSPTISLWEKESNWPGWDGGGPVQTETMRNVVFRTANAKHLITLTPVTLKVAYSTGVLDDIENNLNKNQEFITILPDGTNIVYWGYLDKFTPDSLKEGEQPTATVIIQPTNINAAGVEVAPYAITPQPNEGYAALSIGQPPSVYRYAIFSWFTNYERIRLVNVPLDRATTYYFAQAGDDTTGNGSEATPWKTLVKAQAVLTAASNPAHLRLRFKRGDTWRELTVLDIQKSHVTIDDYGSVNDAEPLFTRFTRQIPAGGGLWAAGTGDDQSHALTGTRGWVRDAADDGTGEPYWEQTGVAGVQATPRSFYHNTGSNTLVINASPDDADDLDLEIAPLDATGWAIQADNVRMENIRIHGSGMHVEGSAGYGLWVHHANTSLFEECVLINVECYYTGYHSIGHIGHQNGQSCTMIDCKAGFCTDRNAAGVHGSTPYVSFATFGGQELYMRDCEVTCGMLPSVGWGASAAVGRGGEYGIYQHTAGADYPSISICINTKFPDRIWQVLQTSWITAPLWTSDEATQVRAYIVDERPVMPNMGGILGYGLHDRVRINCENTFVASAGVHPFLFQQITGANDFDGLAINCKLNYDVSLVVNGGTGGGIWSGVGEDINMRLENCRISVTGISAPVDFFCAITLDSATMGPRIRWRNTIVNLAGSVGSADYGAFLGAVTLDENDDDNMVKPGTGRLINNAYHLVEGSSQPHSATYLDGDTGAVSILTPIPDTTPQGGNVLFHTGAANGLEYDFNRNPRNLTTPTIGPNE